MKQSTIMGVALCRKRVLSPTALAKQNVRLFSLELQRGKRNLITAFICVKQT